MTLRSWEDSDGDSVEVDTHDHYVEVSSVGCGVTHLTPTQARELAAHLNKLAALIDEESRG